MQWIGNVGCGKQKEYQGVVSLEIDRIPWTGVELVHAQCLRLMLGSPHSLKSGCEKAEKNTPGCVRKGILGFCFFLNNFHKN